MSEAVDKLVAVEEYIASLKEDIADLEGKLTKLNEQINEATADKEKAEKDRDAVKETAVLQKQKLKAEIDAINYKKDTLLIEQKKLEESVSNLKVETAQMIQKVADFKTYESRAMQVLRTKEASLVERERAVREKESLSPLLPER